MLQERIDRVSSLVFMPVILLLNFSLFQYLVGVYLSRRREPRIILLFVVAALSFLTIGCFTVQEPKFVRNMNDVSEVCTVLTFLLQINIIGRDVLRKLRLPSLRRIVLFAEILVTIGLALVLFNFIDLGVSHDAVSMLDWLDIITKDVGLAFTFFFRFYFVAAVRGGQSAQRKQKLEMTLYALLVIHNYPFLLVKYLTGLSLVYVEAVCMRLLVAACLGLSFHQKMLKSKSRAHDDDRGSQTHWESLKDNIPKLSRAPTSKRFIAVMSAPATPPVTP